MSIQNLIEYIQKTTEHDDSNNVFFFGVKAKDNAKKEFLLSLIKDIKHGQFRDLDILDGEAHSYIDVGAWIGDQGLALALFGLGESLGLWKILSPKTFFGDMTSDQETKLAGQGYVAIQVVDGKD